MSADSAVGAAEVAGLRLPALNTISSLPVGTALVLPESNPLIQELP